MEMDNHMSDKDESCYDNAEAAFSDDEEDLNSKGEARSRGCPGRPSPGSAGRSRLSVAFASPPPGGFHPQGCWVQSPALGAGAGRGCGPGLESSAERARAGGRLLGGHLRRCPGRVTAFLNHPLQGRRESFASTLSRRRSWRSQSTSPRTSTSWTSPSGTKSSSCRRAGGHSPCAWLCPVLSGWQGGGPGGHVLGARRGSWSRVKCLLRFRGLGLGVGRPRSPAPQFSLRGSEGRGFCEPKQAGGDVPPPWAVPTEHTVPEPPLPGPQGPWALSSCVGPCSCTLSWARVLPLLSPAALTFPLTSALQ